MKKALKIFTITIGVLLAIIIILTIVAKIKEKEIADIALRKISASIKAPLVIDDISLSLLRKFPLATIEFENVQLGSSNALSRSDSLISDENTLANIKKLFISVKSIPLFRGEFEIMKVEIKGVDFSYIVDSQGRGNFDFLIDTTPTKPDTSAFSLNIMLKELLIRDVHCNYYDSLNLMGAQIVVPKVKLNGQIGKDMLQASAKGELKLANCSFKNSPLNLMQETELDFDLDLNEDSVDVKELIITTDGADLNITGNLILKDKIPANLTVEGTNINIGELLKYAPKKTLADIGLKKASGEIKIKASVRGLLIDSIFPEVIMNIEMKDGFIQNGDYPAIKNISFAGFLTNGKLRNNKTTSATFKKFHAETENSTFDLSFSLNNLDRIRYKINSDIDIRLEDFKEFIPDTIVSSAKGQIRAKINSKGVLPHSFGKDFIDYILETSQAELTFNDLFITLDTSLSLNSLSGHLTYELNHITAREFYISIPNYKININNSSFDAKISGKLSHPSSLGIDLNSFQIRTDSSVVYGSVKVQNLKSPEYDITSSIKLNLNEVKNFLPDTLINRLSGEITAQITSDGRLNLDSIPSQINDLIFKRSSFLIEFNRVIVDMPDTLINIKEFSGKLSMKPDTIEINNVHGIYSGIDFSINSTKIVNLYNTVITNQASQLYVDGQFNLGDLDYTMFAPFIEGKTDSSIASKDTNRVDSTVTNYTYLFKGKLGIRSFTYKKAIVENITSLFKISDSLYVVDQFKFDGFNGKHNTSIRYAIKEKEKMLWVKNNVEGMDVNQLLRDFNNFKEYYEPAITYDNISGVLSSDVNAQLLFIEDSLVMDKLYVKGTLKLEKGGIYKYPPLKEMEPFLPGIDNLDILEFKTINSNIFVFQNAIYVPATLVVSNKLDAQALGMKSFGEDYEYHFMVFLSDILLGKKNKIKKQQDKMGDVVAEAGRKGTSLIYSKKRRGYDTQNERKEMERKVKASEKLLNLRFNPYVVNYNTGVK